MTETSPTSPTSIVPPEYVPRDVRAWAVDNGWPALAGRNGRMPAAAIRAYATAHPAERTMAELAPSAATGSDSPGASVAGSVPPLTTSPEEQRVTGATRIGPLGRPLGGPGR